jgi:NAD(P)-dependent dehydrogenase (short-subunit alcohol dehydrogenase family)
MAKVMDWFSLQGRRALITGGSRGLGRAMAQALADAGADLVLVGRDEQNLRQAAAELSKGEQTVVALAADLNSPEEAEKLCDRALAECGPIDILINNVGGRRENIPTEAMQLEIWRRYLDLNLTSAFVCTKRFGAAMLPRKWGRIINVASISGQVAVRGIAGRHYETAKAALVGFTKAVAADWAAQGVTVNAIAPGGFLTDANRRWFRERPEFIKEFEAQIPMGRLGEPEEMGPLAVYLASEASRYMTGATLIIDGGYTLW